MITVLGAIAGFLSVAFGAFGAHALGYTLTEKAAGWWETATLYLLIHAALATALSAQNSDKFGGAAAVLLAGAVLFAATLYAMSLGAPRWLGAITPIGGLGMLAGWAMIAWAAFKT
ncbi:MAG: DUF423 domain-containing protein [Henriciella sp.]|nr:DUF423 domain-containing protein [Henriciella sp.]